MVFWIAGVAGLAIAYLLGSTPTGYLAGKLLKGIDIREHGSKSTGATNVLRTLGKWPALVVLLNHCKTDSPCLPLEVPTPRQLHVATKHFANCSNRCMQAE